MTLVRVDSLKPGDLFQYPPDKSVNHPGWLGEVINISVGCATLARYAPQILPDGRTIQRRGKENTYARGMMVIPMGKRVYKKRGPKAHENNDLEGGDD